MAAKKSNRSGVALIIVLGLVAILMIVSVTFTIHMRIERAGASNLRHAAVARQIVKGGLAGALMAIDKDVGDDAVPQWFDPDVVTALTYQVKYDDDTWTNLWRDTLVSFPTKSGVDHVAANIFTIDAEQYFPAGLAYRGYALKYSPRKQKNAAREWKGILTPEWIPVYSDVNNDNVMGRYAFFALDATGMLDASCMTNSSASRWMGRDPGEMAVATELFPKEILNAKQFAEKNKNAGTYETLAEFQRLNDKITDNRSFSTFSYDPGPTNDAVYIGGNAASIKANKSKIIKAFYDCGLTAGKRFGTKDCEQARWAYLGLVDYVDDNDEMEDDDQIHPWQRPATENIPVVSGFMVKLTIERRERVVERGEGENRYYEKDPAHCEMKLTGEFKIPFVYPFVEVQLAPTMTLEGKATFCAGDNCGEPFLPENVEGNLFPYGPWPENPKGVATGDREFKGSPDDDNSLVSGLSIGSDGWCVLNNNNGTPPSLSNAGNPLDIFFVAAGQTKHNGKVQHRFPANESNYATPFDDTLHDFTWMTVPFNFHEENVDLTDADLGDEETVGPGQDGNPVRRKTWRKEIVAWAEVFDPRFSSLAMAESKTWSQKRMYCRPSHSRSGDDYNPGTAKHYQIPVTKVKDEGNAKTHYASFTAAGSVSAADFDDSNILPKYFRGRTAENGGDLKSPYGATPLTSYALTHPDVAEKVFKMNVDGIRLADGEDRNSTDPARMKWRAFVKNAPLESVGELGYLPIGMWYTIRLYDYGNKRKIAFDQDLDDEMTKFNHLPVDDANGARPFHPVLDYFTVVDQSKETVRGRINLNSLNENALATAFYRMPIGTELENSGNLTLWPNLTDPNSFKARLNLNSAKLMTEAIVACRKDAGDFESLSDLGYIFGYGFDNTTESTLHGDYVSSYAVTAICDTLASGDDFGEFERESLIRNSCGLFTTRGQTFIVVVRGESYSPPFGRRKSIGGGTSNASKTIIAQVWRDSVADGNGNHPMYVQFFKIIDD